MGGRGALGWAPLGAVAVLAGVAVLAVLAAPGAAETGAPALEQDGVWRARADWVIEEGETVLHDGEALEAFGNLTLQGNATLSVSNGSLRFVDAFGGTRSMAAAPRSAFLLFNATMTAEGRFATEFLDAAFEAERCTIRFTGGPGRFYSLHFVDGLAGLTECQVYSEADYAVSVESAHFAAVDCDFLRLSGEGGGLYIAGRGSHELDTTSFGRISLRENATLRMFSTVRFLLRDPFGQPAAGRVNGTSAFGELFDFVTAPGDPTAVRVTWYRAQLPAEDIEFGGGQRGLSALQYTAFNDSIGGHSGTASIGHHRENFTVTLDQPHDVGFEAFGVAGLVLEGPPLRRAFYVNEGDAVSVLFTVKNWGAKTSPPMSMLVERWPVDPATWDRAGARELVEGYGIPALAPLEVWNVTRAVTADAFGGLTESTTNCTRTQTYTAVYHALINDAGDGDFGAWNDERFFTVQTFDVAEKPEARCIDPNSAVLPAIALGAVAAVTAAAAVSFYFSDKRAARRAARERADEPAAPPPPRP